MNQCGSYSIDVNIMQCICITLDEWLVYVARIGSWMCIHVKLLALCRSRRLYSTACDIPLRRAHCEFGNQKLTTTRLALSCSSSTHHCFKSETSPSFSPFVTSPNLKFFGYPCLSTRCILLFLYSANRLSQPSSKHARYLSPRSRDIATNGSCSSSRCRFRNFSLGNLAWQVVHVQVWLVE